jgi:thiamine pyrophosphate-dependent acetolactate synthase large subunit-like protein
MTPVFRLFFSAVVRGREKNPKLWQTVRFKFIGTSYAPSGHAKKVVEPIAAEFGLQDIVEEQTDRIPYFDALAAICGADGLLIIGSESPSYSPSKIFPYVLARRPTLAILHRDGSAAKILRHCQAATMIEFDDQVRSSALSADGSLAEFMRNIETGTQPAVDWSAFSKYSAREMTRQLVAVFNRAVNKRED